VLIEFQVLEDEVNVESAFDGSMVDAFYERGGIN
jgi:hypothetical protein